MTQITTTGGMITFLDTVTGLSKQIGQNQLWLQFSTRGDTVNFLRISIPTDGSDGTPFWSARASDLTIDGESYTIEQLKSGAGTDGLFSTMSFSYEIVEELPETGEPNIIYLVYDDETGTYTEYLWLAQEQTYEVLGSVADIDLGNYYTKSQTDNLLAGKQATLTAGANITIENNVISATGGGGSADLTNYYTKTETDTLLNTKANTSSLATVATSGAYSDLSGTPTNVSAFTNDAGYLTQHQSLADVFGKVNYDSSTKRINFYGKDDTSMTNVLGYVDATSFVVDGMVEDVRIENGYLVIDFNTDSGITDISIPLTDIFDPSNYYTKSETDTLLSAKASTSSLATVATTGSYNDLSDKPVIPSGVTVDQTLDTSSTNAIANSAVATALNSKADSSALSDYATTSAMNTALAGKQDTLTAGTGITITNNVISATAPSITVDSALSSTSTNPVENRAIYAAIGDIEQALAILNGTNSNS